LKAIVVSDEAARTAAMKLVERLEPQAAINDVVVEIHASGFVPTEMAWPSTSTDRLNRDRTPSIPGHELAGVVTVLGYGTTGLSVGQRVSRAIEIVPCQSSRPVHASWLRLSSGSLAFLMPVGVADDDDQLLG
jgi:NADPH:quinone reductase-like Zn-dependent oxidoreductase